jgi:hypothetical protein
MHRVRRTAPLPSGGDLMREQTCSKSELIIRVRGTKRGWNFGVFTCGDMPRRNGPWSGRLLCTCHSSPADWYAEGASRPITLGGADDLSLCRNTAKNPPTYVSSCPTSGSTELRLTATPKHLPEEIGIAEKNGMSRYDKALHTQPASSTGQPASSSN